MAYPLNAQFQAAVIALNPSLQSRLLNGLTNLEQAFVRLDKMSGVGARVAMNMLSGPYTVVAGTWAPAIDATQLFGGYLGNDGAVADNDGIDVKFYLPSAGTWQLRVGLPQDDDAPIVKLYIDAVQIGLVGGYDQYSFAPDVFSFIGVSGLSLAAGLHTLRIYADGKNGASSDYVIRLNAIEFRRTA